MTTYSVYDMCTAVAVKFAKLMTTINSIGNCQDQLSSSGIK